MNRSVLSHWWRMMELKNGGALPDRPSLEGDRDADVVIVGAGYTGLWTALELLKAKPTLDVVVLEAKVAGYGASGRNGGAVIGQLNGSRGFWAKKGGGRHAAIAMEKAVQDSIDAIAEVVTEESIDCGFSKNGVLVVARSPLEDKMLAESVEVDREFGFGPEDSRYLNADEVSERISVAGARGARYSAHCASVDGARLAWGLAKAVEARGGTIYEHSPVRRIESGVAVTDKARVKATYVIRATEAYTESIDNQRGQLIPVHTSMIVTEPLGSDVIAQIGWSGREAVLAEHPFLHLQFTPDNRITIGGDDPRVPYLFGSAPNPEGEASPKVVAHYRGQLIKMFPVLKDAKIAGSWQGIFGVSRLWAPGVGLDKQSGLGYAGGYVGEGLASSNMAGRTMRDLVLGESTELTALPWTNLTARRWEPEPLRYIGAGVIWSARAFGDHTESKFNKPSRVTAVANKITGFTGHLG